MAGAEQAAAEAHVLDEVAAEARARVERLLARDLVAVGLAALAAEPPALRRRSWTSCCARRWVATPSWSGALSRRSCS